MQRATGFQLNKRKIDIFAGRYVDTGISLFVVGPIKHYSNTFVFLPILKIFWFFLVRNVVVS